MMPSGKYSRDYYLRKLKKHEQEYYNYLADCKRFTKEEVRELNRKKNKTNQHLEGLSSFINESLNPYIFNNKYSLYMIRDGHKLLVVDYATNKETVYVPLYTSDLDNDFSLVSSISEVSELEKKYEIHFKRNYITTPEPKWYDNNSIHSPQLYMKDGGYVSHGSWRNLDHINCLLTAHEYVITAPAVRGLGKGSYALGSTVLDFMQDIWKRESKLYAHRR